MEIRCATAFRWGPPRLAGCESDVLRVVEDGGMTLVLMANASDGGFASCWPAGSRLLLDLFEVEWAGTQGDVVARLGAAFRGVARRFAETAPSLYPEGRPDEDDSPCGCLLALVGTSLGWHAAWVGGDIALLVRRGEVVAATQPHSLIDHLRRQDPDFAVDPVLVPAILTRMIGLPAEREAPPSLAKIEWHAGDRLVLMNWSLHRGNERAAQEVAIALQKSSSPAAFAEQLAEEGFARAHAAFAAVAVIDLSATEVVMDASLVGS